MSPRTQIAISQGGSAPKLQVYYAWAIAYFCDAVNWTLLTDKLRRIKRVTYTDSTRTDIVSVEAWYDPADDATIGWEYNLVASNYASYSYN